MHSSISHIVELEYHCDQHTSDLEFIHQTISTLTEIKTILIQMHQICMELKEIHNDTKYQKSSETNIIEDIVKSIDEDNSNILLT